MFFLELRDNSILNMILTRVMSNIMLNYIFYQVSIAIFGKYTYQDNTLEFTRTKTLSVLKKLLTTVFHRGC